MMHMTFYWSTGVTLLIDSWKTDSWTSYSLTLLACVVVSTFYQYIEDRRVRLKLAAAGKSPPSQIESPLLEPKVTGKWSTARLAGSVLFGINSAIGYLLMLAVMSFNGGVFIAIVLGLSIGYLAFRSGVEDVAVADAVDNPCACS